MRNELEAQLNYAEGKRQNHFLSNRVVGNMSFREDKNPLEWQFTLLKYNEYDSNLHYPMQNADKPHFHSFFEIHMPVEGDLEYWIEDACVQVRQGSFLLIAPKVVHQLKDMSPLVKKYSFAFQVSSRMQKKDPVRALGGQSHYVGAQFAQMLEPLQYVLAYTSREETNGDYGAYLIRAQYDSFFLAFLEHMERTLQREEGTTKRQDNMELNDQMIYERVITYLQKHMSEHVMISEVSRELLISERQLNRRLVRFKGIPFSKIQEQVKCQRARELLESNLSLSEISGLIGMGNEYSFSRFFKRVEGMPPARFRMLLRSSNYK